MVGDVIVGADGTFSKIRASVLGHEVPVVSTGKCCYRLLIPTADLLADPNTAAFADTPELAIQIAGEDRWIFLYQCSGGRSANLAAFVPKDEVGEIKKGNHFSFPTLFIFKRRTNKETDRTDHLLFLKV